MRNTPKKGAAGNEEESFGHLEHTGRRTNRSYVLKRLRH